jgi:hypothetical protein
MININGFHKNPFKELGVHSEETLGLLLHSFEPVFIDGVVISDLDIFKNLSNHYNFRLNRSENTDSNDLILIS